MYLKKLGILAIMTLTVLSTTSAMAVDAANVKAEEARVAAEKRMDILIGESASAARLTAQAQALYEIAVAKAKAEAEAKARAEEEARLKAEAEAKAKAAAEAAAKRQVAAQRASRAAQRVSAPAAVVQGSGGAAQAVAYALAQVGKRYVHGAVGPGAYDCSGLTMAAWRSAGVGLPHNSRAQFGSRPRVAIGNLQPGDLVFYYSPISHVAIYIGGGKIVDAANPRTGVRIASVGSMPISGAVRP